MGNKKEIPKDPRISLARQFCKKISTAKNLLLELGPHTQDAEVLQKMYDYYKNIVDTYERLNTPPTVLYQLYGNKKYKDLEEQERKDYEAFLARVRRAKKRCAKKPTT
jgi:hypothetical protein